MVPPRPRRQKAPASSDWSLGDRPKEPVGRSGGFASLRGERDDDCQESQRSCRGEKRRRLNGKACRPVEYEKDEDEDEDKEDSEEADSAGDDKSEEEKPNKSDSGTKKVSTKTGSGGEGEEEDSEEDRENDDEESEECQPRNRKSRDKNSAKQDEEPEEDNGIGIKCTWCKSYIMSVQDKHNNANAHKKCYNANRCSMYLQKGNPKLTKRLQKMKNNNPAKHRAVVLSLRSEHGKRTMAQKKNLVRYVMIMSRTESVAKKRGWMFLPRPQFIAWYVHNELMSKKAAKRMWIKVKQDKDHPKTTENKELLLGVKTAITVESEDRMTRGWDRTGKPSNSLADIGGAGESDDPGGDKMFAQFMRGMFGSGSRSKAAKAIRDGSGDDKRSRGHMDCEDPPSVTTRMQRRGVSVPSRSPSDRFNKSEFNDKQDKYKLVLQTTVDAFKVAHTPIIKHNKYIRYIIQSKQVS